MSKIQKKSLTNGDLCGKVASNNALIEWVMDYIEADDDFTGEIKIEIHCKNGQVKDFYTGHRKREIV